MCMALTDPALRGAVPVGAGAPLQQDGMGKGARDAPSTPGTLPENAAVAPSSVSITELAGQEYLGAMAWGSPAPALWGQEQRRGGRVGIGCPSPMPAVPRKEPQPVCSQTAR